MQNRLSKRHVNAAVVVPFITTPVFAADMVWDFLSTYVAVLIVFASIWSMGSLLVHTFATPERAARRSADRKRRGV